MDNALGIDWSSNENNLLLNSRLPQADANRARQAWQKWSPLVQGHIGLLTSGSTSGGGRLIFLSKKALLTSAAAVNTHLSATANDIWLKTLPDFHVGGLGIHVRALLGGARVNNEMGEIGTWSVSRFHELATKTGATLVSLVPSQVFDLVTNGLKAPPSLRAIIVGGGALSHDLFVAATRLGWPVLPSYGLTECCSQVGTAQPADWLKARLLTEPERLPIFLLPHVTVENSGDSPLKIRSASLLTARITLADDDDDGAGVFEDPKVDGWFQTEDRVQVVLVDGRPALDVQGRGADFVKVGGESVSLGALEAKLQKLRIEQNYEWDLALIAVEDARLGHVINLLSAPAPAANLQTLIEAFAQQVLPFERIRRVIEVETIPRSALGKLLQTEARKLVLAHAPRPLG